MAKTCWECIHSKNEDDSCRIYLRCIISIPIWVTNAIPLSYISDVNMAMHCKCYKTRNTCLDKNINESEKAKHTLKQWFTENDIETFIQMVLDARGKVDPFLNQLCENNPDSHSMKPDDTTD